MPLATKLNGGKWFQHVVSSKCARTCSDTDTIEIGF